MRGDLAQAQGFEWLDRAFVEDRVHGFVEALDKAMDRWRVEYDRLDAERRAINRQLGEVEVDHSLNRRRSVIESKLQKMREGQGDWYLYRYLGGEGFLPGYAFPPQATAIAFDDREDEMTRDPDIALTEFAPGNFVYYRGERYEVTHARPRRRAVAGRTERLDTELDVEPVVVCPACECAYVGDEETHRAACTCGQDLNLIHPRPGMQLTDMYATQRAHITADEEERLRLGYEVTSHYRAGGDQRVYQVGAQAESGFRLTLEQGGEVLRVNRGQRQQEGDPEGFTLCGKCHRWLIGDDAAEKHVYTPSQQGKCPRHGKPQDLVRAVWLTKAIHSDLALFDVPLRAFVGESSEPMAPAEIEAIYTTLAHSLGRALMVAFNLDESELGGFLARSAGTGPAAEPEAEAVPYRVVLYETTVGGSGVLASLAEPGQLEAVVLRARELLHEGDPEGGCQKACYACLLSFYNQRVHDLLDRTLVLPWLQDLKALTIEPVVSESRFDALTAKCESELERQVLRAIRDRELRLPDEAQQTIYDGDVPLAIADFFYEPKVVVFVDGSPHHRDYVLEADDRKRRRLKALGYRVVVVTAEEPEKGLEDLASRVEG
jgi:very-short-patch-repair endonuclease